MAALCKYGSAKAAAYSLNRSPKTADTHMLHIRDKMRPLNTNILRCLAYREWERTAPKVYPVGAGDGDTYVVPGPVVIHKDGSKPRCAGCGTTKNLHRDYGSGGPYRCDSSDCVVL
jgi:hypothetical protein